MKKIESINDLSLKLNTEEKENELKKNKAFDFKESEVYDEVKTTLNADNKRKDSFDYPVNGIEWEVPVFMDEYNLPPFPIEIYTPSLRNMAQSVADFTQTPTDLAAMATIGALSTALSQKFVVEPRVGWKENVNTYTMPLMMSSNRKTAVIQNMIKPIYAFENELIKESKPVVKKREAERKVLDKLILKLQNDYAKTSEMSIREKMNLVIDEKIQLPPLFEPSLVVNEATPDAAIRLLKENNEKISIISAEGNFLEKFKGKNTKPDVFNAGYNGVRLKVIGSGCTEELLGQPLITICIATNPSIMESIPDALHDGGFIPSFLFACPQDFVGYRNPTAPSVQSNVENEYTELLTRLLDFSTPEPIVLCLTPKGKKILNKLEIEMEKEFLEGGILQDELRVWGGKLIGNLVRIAGLLHVSKYAGNAKNIDDIPIYIDDVTLSSALRLKDYFISHAEKAFGTMRQNSFLADAKFVLKKIQSQGIPTVSRQDIWQATRKTIESAKRLDDAFRVLESRKLIKRIKDGKSGRKEFIQLNPWLSKLPNTKPAILSTDSSLPKQQ